MPRVALLRPQEQVPSDVCMGAEKWSKGFMKETCEDLTGAVSDASTVKADTVISLTYRWGRGGAVSA